MVKTVTTVKRDEFSKEKMEIPLNSTRRIHFIRCNTVVTRAIHPTGTTPNRNAPSGSAALAQYPRGLQVAIRRPPPPMSRGQGATMLRKTRQPADIGGAGGRTL